MQGKVTVEGDMSKVMALMPLTTSAEYQAVQHRPGPDRVLTHQGPPRSPEFRGRASA